MTPKLEEWLQQIPGATSELSVQKSAVLGTAKRPLVEDPEVEEDTHTTHRG